MKRSSRIVIVVGAAAILASASALFLDKSLPYRIGLADYKKYLLVGRLVYLSIGFTLMATLFGLLTRKAPISVGIPLLALAPLFFIGGVHSGPNPEAWCFNNLRRIEGAKEQYAEGRGLTNGAALTIEDLSRFISGNPTLRCAEGGRYIINPIGSDARCTIHGSIPEMEATWQKTVMTTNSFHPAH